MGIKKLNTYFMETCSHDAISRVPLSHFKGKRLVIDTSIYIYKFLSEDALLENFYTMLTLFKQYQISPLFVFDGKPPVEKNDVIWERFYKRKEAEAKYKEMIESLNTQGLDETEKQKEIEKLSGLKRQFVRVTDEHIDTLKQLFSNFNVSYIDAPSESDLMCAYLVKTKKAYGCISDDMDMFAYDCPVVIRKLNLIHHNCLLYDSRRIKQELEIDHLQDAIILCGTDYNTGISWDITNALQRYRFYEDETDRKQTAKSFYEWLFERNFIESEQLEKVTHVRNMFQVPETMECIYTTRQPDWTVLQPLLESHGFIFME